MIYHIAVLGDWDSRTDKYAPEGWRDEGFVHCAADEQVVRTANRLFAGRRDLVLLSIDPARLTALVVWEDTAGVGEDFPHVYGPIDVAAVVGTAALLPAADGEFSWQPPRA